MKKILMAHDLSHRSERALERAVQLALQVDAELEVVHVVEDDLPSAIVERRKTEAERVIHDHLSSIPGSGGRKIIVNVLAGKDYTDILAQADRLAADLIVLGIHREDALRHLVIGSTAERVIGFGIQPVLVVKDQPRGSYHRVLMLADLSGASRRAAKFSFALLPNAEFRLVHAYRLPLDVTPADKDTHFHIYDMHEEGLKKRISADLLAFVCPAGVHAERFELALHQGPTLEAIRQEVERFRPDVLVIGTQHRAGLTRSLIGDVAEDLLSQPPCDLLAVHG